MSRTPPADSGPEPQRPFLLDREPFAGFEVAVLVDRPVYAPGETVRITVSATNGGRARELEYPGWQRYALSVRDEHHREVAHDAADRTGPDGFRDRWLPGQMVLFPVYWGQQEGVIVPSWSSEPPGPRVLEGRYRLRLSWRGREPGSSAEVGDVWSSWFELI